MNQRITVGIPSKDRGLELSLLLYSLLDQTYQNFDILIINDHTSNFFENTTFRSIIKLHENLGHTVTIIKGDIKGPHYAGQKILENSQTELIFRVDDDVTLQSDCIENLLSCFEDDGVVAAGPIYLLPHVDIKEQMIDLNEIIIDDVRKVWLDSNNNIYVNGILQMNILNTDENIQVEHLHSGFVYKKSRLEKIGGYFLGYSKIGHREETDTSYRLHLDGGKLVICPTAVAFHFHPFWGGIRTDEQGNQNDPKMWENDEKIFIERFKNNFPMNNKYDQIIHSLNKSKSINDIRIENGHKPIKGLNDYLNEIHLVTVTHGNHEKLEKLMDSIYKYTKILFSWTIVNNDPSDESYSKLISIIYKNEKESKIPLKISHIQLDKEVSVSEARNIGAKQRPDDIKYICFVDDDALVLGRWSDKDWLDIMVDKIKSEKDIGAVSPIHTWFDPLKSYVLSVACLMVPVKVWNQVGGFDPIFGNKEKGTWGYEDTDWSYRLQQMGYKIKGIDAENFPFYHEDTTGKEKSEWQEKGLLEAKELLLSKYDAKEIQNYIRTGYPFTSDQMQIRGSKLNLCCYYMKLEGFINIDINPDCNPDTISDIRELEFENKSISLILVSQAIEHFDLIDCKYLLSQFYKWLKPGGQLIVEVPDVGKILDLVENGDNINKYNGAIHGNSEVMGMKHRSQFDNKLLTGMLNEAGFKNIIRNNETSDNNDITLRFDCIKD